MACLSVQNVYSSVQMAKQTIQTANQTVQIIYSPVRTLQGPFVNRLLSMRFSVSVLFAFHSHK